MIQKVFFQDELDLGRKNLGCFATKVMIGRQAGDTSGRQGVMQTQYFAY
jgi:hypothetical protein